MTTNVRDSIEKVFAADSRWSIDLRPHELPWIWFSDDAPYQKIIMAANAAFMFAGNSSTIDVWKSAAKLADAYPDAVNWGSIPLDGIAVSIAAMGDGKVIFEHGHVINGSLASFAGSGATLAMACWSKNRIPEKAVQTASQLDRFTGGTVRYCRLNTGNTNFGPDKALTELNSHIATEGLAMHVNENKDEVMTIAQAVSLDPRLTSIVNQVQTGRINAIAPHEGLNSKATPEQQSKMADAMQELFSRRR